MWFVHKIQVQQWICNAEGEKDIKTTKILKANIKQLVTRQRVSTKSLLKAHSFLIW